MQFLYLICHDDAFTPPLTLEPDVVAWVEELKKRGKRVSGDRLRPADEAKTLRVRDGRMALADGPAAQTKNKVAGYELVDCADMAEAVALAATHPMALLGTIEVRQIWNI